jgi:hypothetical protein
MSRARVDAVPPWRLIHPYKQRHCGLPRQSRMPHAGPPRNWDGGRSATRESAKRAADRTSERVLFCGPCPCGGDMSLAGPGGRRGRNSPQGTNCSQGKQTGSLPAPARWPRSSARSLAAVKGERKPTPAAPRRGRSLRRPGWAVATTGAAPYCRPWPFPHCPRRRPSGFHSDP